MWEYKPQVPSELVDVTAGHLSETFLQAYYLRDSSPYPILHCLTNLEDYHYFSITTKDHHSMKIEKYVEKVSGWAQRNLRASKLKELNVAIHNEKIAIHCLQMRCTLDTSVVRNQGWHREYT